MDNIDSNVDMNIDSNNSNLDNSNTVFNFCQEASLEDCNCCEHKEECVFWSEDSYDFDEFEYTWKEMSYRKFVQRSVSFRHSELNYK